MILGKKNYKSNNIRGKLKVCGYLSANPNLKSMVPHSKSFTRENLSIMSEKYNNLYIKPDVGSMGIGIYKLIRKEAKYELLSVNKRKQTKKTFKTISGVYKHIRAKSQQKLLIQQAITLDRVKGRPYDIRVMIQRKPKGPWVCTGFLVKLGRDKKIVNNYYQGGKIITINQLLKDKGLSPANRKTKINMLTDKGLKVARALSKKRSGMHEMGIDFAISRKQNLYVLEVNSNHPQFHPLKKIDKTAYDKMMHYAKSYGRKSAK